MKKQLDDCGYSSGLRGRLRDGSVLIRRRKHSPRRRGLSDPEYSEPPSLDDCEDSSGLRDRFRDGSARLDGHHTAPSSTNRGLNQSANGRVAERGARANDGHHVGLDKRLPSHGRSTRSALQSEGYGHPRGHLARHATVTHLSAVRPGATDGGPRKQSTPRRPSVYGGRRCGSCRRSVREDNSRESPATGGPAPDTRPTHRLDRSTCRQGEQQLALEEGAAMPRRRP